MSQPAPLHAETTTDAIGAAVTGDARMQTQRELRIATRLLIGVVLFVVFVAVLVALFGLPALGIVAMIGAVTMLTLLVAYAAGY